MRSLDRILALVLGLALAGLGGLVAIEATLLSSGRPALVVPRARWDRGMSGLAWSSATLQVAAIIAIAVGAALVLLQLVPRAPRRLRLEGVPGRAAWIAPVSVARAVERAVVRTHDEVGSARVRVTRRTARVRADVVVASDEATPERVAATVSDALDTLELGRELRVRVRLDRSERRVR